MQIWGSTLRLQPGVPCPTQHHNSPLGLQLGVPLFDTATAYRTSRLMRLVLLKVFASHLSKSYISKEFTLQRNGGITLFLCNIDFEECNHLGVGNSVWNQFVVVMVISMIYFRGLYGVDRKLGVDKTCCVQSVQVMQMQSCLLETWVTNIVAFLRLQNW